MSAAVVLTRAGLPVEGTKRPRQQGLERDAIHSSEVTAQHNFGDSVLLCRTCYISDRRIPFCNYELAPPMTSLALKPFIDTTIAWISSLPSRTHVSSDIELAGFCFICGLVMGWVLHSWASKPLQSVSSSTGFEAAVLFE